MLATHYLGDLFVHLHRRQFVVGAVTSMAAPTLLAGCGRSTPSPPAQASPPNPRLTFDDSGSFYAQLQERLADSKEVIVQFDGQHRVGRDSRLMKEFIPHAKNCEELYREVSAKDTPTGRTQLNRVFEDELLEHGSVKESTTLPSGQVIEPTVVILVLGVLLILASVAHAESARGRRYRVGLREPNTGMELFFQGEP